MEKLALLIKTGMTIVLILAVLGLLSLTGLLDSNESENQQNLYCEMTQIYKDSNGQYGWPEYNKEVECDE